MADTVRRKLADFLTKQKVNANCEACGHNAWGIPDDDAATMRLPVAQPGGAVAIPGPAIPAYVVICNHCGNLRFHAVAVVDPAAMSTL
jgi:ribosomal protein L37E